MIGSPRSGPCDSMARIYQSSNLRPQVGKLGICRTPLADYLALETSVIVYVDDAERTRGEASSYEIVVLGYVCPIQRPV